MVVEIALSLENLGSATVRRKREGDIIAARPPGEGIGLLERSRFLWLRVDVPEALAAVLTDGTDTYKRRYYITLSALRSAWQAAGGGNVNLQRLRDVTDAYQPCLPIDATGRFLPGQARVLNGAGLIFDRTTGQAVP